MRKLLLALALATIAWVGYGKFQAMKAPAKLADAPPAAAPATAQPAAAPASADGQFRCDGRTYCSQMHSCEEATYFVRNCPGTKMDGNHDGVPCERQWCE